MVSLSILGSNHSFTWPNLSLTWAQPQPLFHLAQPLFHLGPNCVQAILTWADLVMLIVYIFIVVSFASTVAIALLQQSHSLLKYSSEVHDITRYLGETSHAT
jgi:hypothetical protein